MTDQPKLFPDRITDWWLLISWTVFAVACLFIDLKFVHPLHWAMAVSAAIGVVGAIMASRRNRSWLPIMLVALVLLFVVMGFYWVGLSIKIMASESDKSLGMVLYRIYQMTAMGLSGGAQPGTVVRALATVYRELVMPLSQLITIGLLVRLWTARPQNI